ncbi:hypothetical protein BDY21DRAFT_367579 [Lineolata rhizophorae]|uniref:Secreted protein n=1 Tax=Lineolata rhizophorae TaxID=578093 RepID=A0A6A6NLY0_9PEZI|nr:hypothetical protein BDY21DRAFT_367579 [Lineolata rhizophorae]
MALTFPLSATLLGTLITSVHLEALRSLPKFAASYLHAIHLGRSPFTRRQILRVTTQRKLLKRSARKLQNRSRKRIQTSETALRQPPSLQEVPGIFQPQRTLIWINA